MYLSHFNLEQYPFTLTPDTEFFLDSGEFENALDVLECSLFTGEGVTKIVGQAGAGKTLLCRKLLNTLDERFVTAYIPNSSMNSKALQLALATELGIEQNHNIHSSGLLDLINRRLISLLAEGKQVVLLLDEAQALPDESMETLRQFSNLETEKTKLLQLVLFGQPELDARLQQDHLRQLRQRIVFSHTIKPLELDSLRVYVQHRLQVAGYRGESLFQPKALSLLQRSSLGIPRLINVLAHKAMLVAFGRGDRLIKILHVQKAIADTDSVNTVNQATLLSASILSVFSMNSLVSK